MNLVTGLKTLVKKDEFISLAASILVIIILTIFRSYWFLTLLNFEALQTSIATSVIVAVGMMILLASGALDLSVGSNMVLSGITTALCLINGFNVVISIGVGLLTGLLIGLLNGFLVAKLKLIPFIATLGTMYMFRGLGEIIMTNYSYSIAGFPQEFLALGEIKIFGLYLVTYVAAIIVVLAYFVMKEFRMGRGLYYIGGNHEGAKLLGFNIARTRIVTFALCGLLTAVAAILSIARFQSVSRYIGTGLNMNAIIACIIGGASLLGGKGSAVGAFLGVTFISLLRNAFNLFEINVLWQSVTLGFILVVVVVADGYMFVQNQRRLGKM